MRKIAILLSIFILSSCIITKNDYKKYIIDNKNDIVQTEPNVFLLDSCNIKNYDDVTIEKYKDNEFIIYFWADIYSRKSSKVITSDKELNKYDIQILNILNKK